MRVLLTGFAPFPGVPINASMRLVPELAAAAKRRFPGTTVSAGLLPTEWVAAPRQMEVLLAEVKPDLLLHFGVSSRARGFEIELRGQNRCDQQPDAIGGLPSSSAVHDGGPTIMRASLPVAYIVSRLRRRGIRAFASRDAGDICATPPCTTPSRRHVACRADASASSTSRQIWQSRAPPRGILWVPARSPGRKRWRVVSRFWRFASPGSPRHTGASLGRLAPTPSWCAP